MNKRWLLLGLAAGLASCSDPPEPVEEQSAEPPSSLEQAAIDAGVIPDVRNVMLSGAFERRSDLGIDRFCAVGNDRNGYQVGLIAVFGPDSKCEGMGEARRNGENVSIKLTSEESCDIDASFDGVELRLAGSIPEACDSYCSPRASLAGVSFYFIGEGDAVARSTRGRDIDSLCPG